MQEDDLPLFVLEAWSQLQTNRAALYNGTAAPTVKELHDVLKITIRKLGNNRAQDLTTNANAIYLHRFTRKSVKPGF